METKSAKMSHQRRQRANPRGIEGSADPLDWSEPAERGGCNDFWLWGVARNWTTFSEDRILEDSKTDIG